jgi:hypothetical protein
MRIVAITVYLILNKASLLRMRGQLLKNAESLEALPLKHSGFNYFLPLERAECGLDYTKNLFLELGFSEAEALVRARLAYYSLVGEFTIGVKTNQGDRLAEIRLQHAI